MEEVLMEIVKKLKDNTDVSNKTVPKVEQLEKDMEQLRLLHVEQQQQIDRLIEIVGK